ncbi:MAG: hypothetical protein L0211_04415 [Planctomycetaceae bacterium]|nr:hypothetical protein [Planctomycetaceae bacterium]
MISRIFFSWTALLLAVILSLTAPALAADDYKPGDLVEVFFLNSWTPAVVIETDKRGNVLAEYEFAGGPKREVFKAQAVRAAYESGAILRGRIWTDPSGKFKTKAALLSVNDDDSITIRKQDMTELKMPLANLSEADKAFIKKLKKEAGLKIMAGPEPPPLEDFGGGVFGSYAVPFNATDPNQRVALAPDPIPSYLKMRQGGVAFGMDDDGDKLGAVLPLGGPDCWILAALENESPWEKSLPTRVLWVSLTKQKLEKKQLLPAGEAVLDYHPPSRRLLTFASLKAEGEHHWNGKPVLTLWETSPTEEKVKPIARWNADSGEGVFHEPWARIIDGNTVLQRYKKQEYVAWDVSAKGIKYRVAQESFFAPLAVLSGGRRYLFLPEDNGVRVMEAATGNLLLGLPTKNGASGIALSEDGRKAAVLEDFELVVWDLTDPQAEPQRFEAQAIGTPFRADLAFVGNERIMSDAGWGGGNVLFSMKTKIALWNYRYDHSAVHEDKGRRMLEVVDRHLVYAATVQSGAQRGLAVGAVQLPGPRVDEVEAVTTYESLLIIKPGTPVKLHVATGQYDDQVRRALEAEIKENGWILSETSNVTITATMGQSETQTVTYGSGGFFGRSQNTESVTVTPFYSSLVIKVGEVVAWQGGTSTGAPPVIWLREGQTAQGEVNKWQNPHPEFFDHVEVPDKIIDPAKRNGLGTTEVTNRGLIVK